MSDISNWRDNLERSRSVDQWVCYEHNDPLYLLYGVFSCMNPNCSVKLDMAERERMMSKEIREAQWYESESGGLLWNQGVPWTSSPPGTHIRLVDGLTMYWHLYARLARPQMPVTAVANEGEFTYFFDWPAHQLVLVRSEIQPFGVEKGSGRPVRSQHQFMYLDQNYTAVLVGEYIASWAKEQPTPTAIEAAWLNYLADDAQRRLGAEDAARGETCG